MASIINSTTTNGVTVQGDNSGSLQLATNNGTTAITIDSSQNVGIGVTSPTGKLAIDATNSNTPRIVFKNPSANGDAAISTFGSSTGTDVVLGSNAYINSAGNFARFDSAQAGSYVYANRTGLLLFGTNSSSGVATERMRVTNGGELYVGTTTGTIDQSNFGFVVAGGELNLSRNVGSSSPTMTAYGSQGLARIMGDGDLENTNNRYTGISDIKFKQNIVDAKSQWSDIKAIQVRNYELIDYPDRKQIGLIAQELEQICPHLVIEREDKDGETYKSVAYSVLYMKAVKALQEAMERIEAIEAKVDAQALEIQELKAELDATKAEVQALKGTL